MAADQPSATREKEIRVLLVEDDEDDYVLVRDILSDIPNQSFHVDWVSGADRALEQAVNGVYDLCLLDYRLGHRNGVEVLDALKARGFAAPILMLTGQGDRRIDLQAMALGAADYLEKDRLAPELMERAVRYAMDRAQTLEALRASEQRLRALSTKLLHAQEEERRRIAKDLHDSIGANMTAVKYALEAKKAQEESGNPASGGLPLDRIIDAVKETMEETQRISTNLRPSILDNMGLLAAIQWNARKTQELYKGLEVHPELSLAEEDIPEPLKIVVFRVVQEALNNTVKHSGADRIDITLQQVDGRLVLDIRDNGKGIEPGLNAPRRSKGGGMGLEGMMERVELSGGDMEIHSTSEEGTRITARWPAQD